MACGVPAASNTFDINLAAAVSRPVPLAGVHPCAAVCGHQTMTRLKRPNLSLAAQLAIVLVAVVVFSTAVVATVAYAAARRSMRDEALQNVMAAADSRKELLRTSLKRRREKADAIVKNIELGCGVSGRMNRICAREALAEYLNEEDARGARLTYGKGK